ncbi:MAG: hypothetical protein QNJ72_36565 [Pleurocapsa sp. MO_226.B13]|nr:hypothetical protein [Pleurocapsa sp. MO_226.B13]
MKRSVLVGLSALTFSLVAAPVFAGEIAAVNRNSTGNVREITPVDLVTRSYQGSFQNQGIPSYGTFVKSVSIGRITAEDLVQSAIASGRLSSETINNQAYISSVKSQLRNLGND